MFLQLIVLVCLTIAVDSYDTTEYPYETTTEDYTPAPSNKTCVLGNINLLDIPPGEYFLINEPIADTIDSPVYVPEDSLYDGTDVSSIVVESNRYVSGYRGYGNGIQFQVKPVIESLEVSQPGNTFFYYNFTLIVSCRHVDGDIMVYIRIPIYETNTFTPVFTQEIFEYDLISKYESDLQRLIELNPIIANDNDLSNTEVIFSIETNDYFDIEYNEIVPHSLHKNHTAKLIVKNSNVQLTEVLELKIFVTDLGYPSKSSNATLRINPVRPSSPKFDRPYYVYDYYLNNTLSAQSVPKLESIPKNFVLSASLSDDNYGSYFQTHVYLNGTITIENWYSLPELVIYKNYFLVLPLTATFRDPNNGYYSAEAIATIIIELHHE